ncbi:MAG: YncE family protein [Acetobacteraceae bacterium]|nr:YncE family protein [Acetobacteraceae bacterium]
MAPMTQRRPLLHRAALAAGAPALLRPARAQAPQPGPPTPGITQATLAPPGPAPDVTDQVSPAARGATLAVVNKLGLTVGFYDAVTGAQQALFSLPSRPHEILLAPDRRTAWVSIYGDGIYGQNPHPGNQVAVLDVPGRRPAGFLSTGDVLAPHGLALARDGTLWISSDIGEAVLGLDSRTGERRAVIPTGTTGGHWVVVTPDGRKAYTSNRAGPGIPALDLAGRRRAGEVATAHATTGLALSSDGARLYSADDQEPALLVVDTATDRVVDTVPLEGLPHTNASVDREKRVRVTPNGKYVLVADYASAGLVAAETADLRRQRLLLIQRGPMGMAFSPDGQTAWVCNHDAGSVTIVDLATMRALRDFRTGEGPETAELVGP